MDSPTATGLTLGLISDTHGLLRPQTLESLRGSDRILHAGDIGGPDLLRSLSALAPVAAVRGNTDEGDWARGIPWEDVLELGGVRVGLVHDLSLLDLDPTAAGLSAVVFGHSHRPIVENRRGILYVNPGSAGPRRFTLPVTVAVMRIAAGCVSAEIRYLRL